MVVETGSTLVTSRAVSTPKHGTVSCTPDEVVCHTTNTTTFELAPLGGCGVCVCEYVGNVYMHAVHVQKSREGLRVHMHGELIYV